MIKPAKKNKSKWGITWAVVIPVIVISLWALDQYAAMGYRTTFILSLILLIFSGIFLILAIRLIAGGHQFAQHPVSYAGRIKVLNRPNLLSFIFFLGYNLTVAGIYWNFAVVLRDQNPHSTFQILGLLLYLEGGLILLIALIPIDLFRIFHVLISILGFAVLVAINVNFLLYTLTRISSLRFSGPYLILSSFQLAISFVYAVAYFAQWDRTSLLQKIWLVASNVTLFVYLLEFINFL